MTMALRVGVRKRSRNLLMEAMNSYNDFTKLIKALSWINTIYGLIFCFLPYMTAIALEMIHFEAKTLLELMCKLVWMGVLIGCVFFTYIINYMGASIARRNRHLAKLLCPLFRLGAT